MLANQLSSLLDRFTTWTGLRVVCADVSFLAVLSAPTLAGCHGDRPPDETDG